MLPDKTYTKLKNMIYRGRLRPGQRLLEVDLSRALSISRIPLRECLVRLESEGLVRRIPNSATFVEDFSPVDFLEMYSMRLVLEPLAARLAALQVNSALVRRLYQLCDQMTRDTKAKNWAKLDRTDYQFHYTIVRASEHQRLIRSYENSHIKITGFRAGYAHLNTSSPNSTAREHSRIVKCLERGDPRGAEKATFDHVSKALHRIEDYLSVRLEDFPKLRPSSMNGRKEAFLRSGTLASANADSPPGASLQVKS
jgi:DNA-binding GntR family transcriptional regulator